MIKLGIIGCSEGNGHPYSFSSIINGYDKEAYKKTDYPVILEYLEKRDRSEIGINGVSVTHAWTQNAQETKLLCEASKIGNAVQNFKEMLGEVDAVMILRDDAEYHRELAEPFLQSNIPVFIDKPLCLVQADLDYFMKYAEQGLLMSTSGFRYAKELDFLREDPKLCDDIQVIDAVVLNDFEKYGIHMLDAISGLNHGHFTHISKINSHVDKYYIQLSDGKEMFLTCLGGVEKVFRLNFYGKNQHYQANLLDNFSAFKRTIKKFITMIKIRQPSIPKNKFENTIQTLINGHQLKETMLAGKEGVI
jgi:hypothetical protein